jgi:hypothetical protein
MIESNLSRIKKITHKERSASVLEMKPRCCLTVDGGTDMGLNISGTAAWTVSIGTNDEILAPSTCFFGVRNRRSNTPGAGELVTLAGTDASGTTSSSMI